MRQLIRLYPKAWQARYGAELLEFLAGRRATVGEVFDLIRGSLSAWFQPLMPQQLVYVPDFGFRPGGTRVLPVRVETTVDRFTLAIVSAAAGPEQTELLIEWNPPQEERSGPENWLVKIDRSGVRQRPPEDIDATLSVGPQLYAPLRVERRFRSAAGYDLRALTFPALVPGTETAELRVARAGREWRVPCTFAPSQFAARSIDAAIEHEGVTLRVTAVARSDEHIVVAVEARTQQPDAHVSTIGRGGGPMARPAQHERKPRRRIDYPLVLADAEGRQSEETSRIREFPLTPHTRSSDPWPLRITSSFAWPHHDAHSVVLTVPCVVVAEQTATVVVDLRRLPVDVRFGPHQVRVLRSEASPQNPPQTRIVLQLPQLLGSRHLLGPGRIVAEGMPGDMTVRGEPDEYQRVWIDTTLANEPLISMSDALVRVDGPWSLALD